MEVQVFFDGDCPLCMREIRLLRRLDEREVIEFTDITAPDFDPSVYGRDYATFMGHIQGRRGDGEWLTGVDVFRALYTAVGFGPLVALTRIWGIRHLLDAAYDVFARNRLRLTGRPEDPRCAEGVCAPLPRERDALRAG